MKTQLSKKEPEKHLLKALKSKAGRNFSGRITVRHQGSGVKKMYRMVDFGQEKLGVVGKVIALEYDPNRTAYLALVLYADGARRYIIATAEVKLGMEILCAEDAAIKSGNRVMLKNIPIGIEICNIEFEAGKGGKMVRSAGSTARVMSNEGGFVQLQMPSKEIRMVSDKCFATIGKVSHPEYRFENLGTAGAMRRKGVRPRVRGSAMNPPDHPHGGGEGRTGIGLRQAKTPWGKPAMGVKTRNRNKWTNKLIIKRRHK
ncbi:MAG: 50S ribosomal protein L2 [Candidatus Paceibacterota bacterium]